MQTNKTFAESVVLVKEGQVHKLAGQGAEGAETIAGLVVEVKAE